MDGKVGAITQVPPTAHHCEVDTGFAALNFDGENIHIAILHVVHRLLMQHVGQGSDLVAQLGSLLKFQFFGVRHHACLQLFHDIFGIAAQKLLGMDYALCVICGRDVPHTGCRTAFDLVEQAGAAAVGKNGILATAQAKYLLHQQNRLFYSKRAGVGAKVAILLVDCPPVVGNPGEIAWRRRRQCAGSFVFYSILGDANRSHFQVGVAFVVPKQNVVLRVLRLDKVVFEQQGFGLGAHYRCF